VTHDSTFTIRAQRSDDQDELFLLLTHEAALLDSVELPYMTEEGFRDRFSNPPADTHVLIAESVLPSARRRIVGAAWLHTQTNRLRHSARLTLLCLPQYRRGDGESRLLEAALALADDWLGLRRVELVVYAGDPDIETYYAGFGFEREATMRRYAVRQGAYANAWLLARLHTPDREARL
jgi:putative acetyltransferase